MSLEIVPVAGLPEIGPGDDVASLVADAASVRDGDVVVVTQKAVSKSEGRVVSGDHREWVARESRRLVARRGELVIAETRHGFVCANAGVDMSNVPGGRLTLLPEDPDASAERIRKTIRDRAGADVGVVICDTFGRPWRRGVVNVAIGCAGIPALHDLRGTPDAVGRILEATVVAVADEIAAAAGLVMGKSDGIPAAVVRGVAAAGEDGRAAELVRPAEEDLFRHGSLTGIETRRSVRSFGTGMIPREALLAAVGAALTAPVPHGSRHRSRPWAWFVFEHGRPRERLLSRMAEAWRRDLTADRVSEPTIVRRLGRSDDLLGAAPVVAVPAVSLEAADDYPDERRREAERDMFLLATGAAVQSFMLALHAQGYASCWVSSTLFPKEEVRAVLGLGPVWVPAGAVAAGRPPGQEPPPRPPLDPASHVRFL